MIARSSVPWLARTATMRQASATRDSSAITSSADSPAKSRAATRYEALRRNLRTPAEAPSARAVDSASTTSSSSVRGRRSESASSSSGCALKKSEAAVEKPRSRAAPGRMSRRPSSSRAPGCASIRETAMRASSGSGASPRARPRISGVSTVEESYKAKTQVLSTWVFGLRLPVRVRGIGRRSFEYAHAARAYQQADDDQDEAGEHTSPEDRDDAPDHQDRRDDPKDGGGTTGHCQQAQHGRLPSSSVAVPYS